MRKKTIQDIIQNIIRNIVRNAVFCISGVISFVLFLVLLAITRHMSTSLPEQMMAERWSRKGGVAQISCFFSPNARVTEDMLQEFEHGLDSRLQEVSIASDSGNPGARLWVDAYSADGRIVVSSDKANLDARAIGVGGDFFLFHPLKLLYGSYFSGNDLNQDYCVIDRDAAWQLFGSSNVAGMMVSIGGHPHVITGVIERETGRLEKAAGLDATCVYVSYQTLDTYGSSSGINHYEIVMPNPVKNFALSHVKDQLGRDERETEILENGSRFSLLNRLKWIGAFGTHSMNGKAIIYPYWENIARGYEEIISLLTLFLLIFLLYPVVLCLILLIRWWKHRGWTFKSLFLGLKDRLELFLDRKRAARRERRKHKEPKKPKKPAEPEEFQEPAEPKKPKRRRKPGVSGKSADGGTEDG